MHVKTGFVDAPMSGKPETVVAANEQYVHTNCGRLACQNRWKLLNLLGYDIYDE